MTSGPVSAGEDLGEDRAWLVRLPGNPAIAEGDDPSGAPSFKLHAGIDLPAEGAKVPAGGELEVSGWAVLGDRAVLAVAVTVVGSGSSKTERAELRPRPDVAVLFGAPAAECGWAATLDLGDFRDATLDVYVTIWGLPEHRPETLPAVGVELVEDVGEPDEDSPRWSDWHREHLLLPDWLVGSLEEPKSERAPLPRDLTDIRGWAIADSGPVDEIEIFVDGTSIGLARPGLHRPDVQDFFHVVHGALSGFEHYVDLERMARSARSVSIRAVARSQGREAILGERTLALAPPTALVVNRASRREQILSARTSELLGRLPSPAPVVAGDGVAQLNLLVVTHDLGYGGGQLWLSELLDKAGAGSAFPCTVLSRAGGPLRDELERRGIEVHVTDEYTLRDIEFYEAQVLEIALWSRVLGHNSVLVNTAGAFVGADVAQRLGLPCVWAIHESWPPDEYWKVNFPRGYVDRRVRAAADRALAGTPAVVFEAEATRLLYEGAAAPGASVVVPYGVDIAEIDAYRAKVSRGEARRRLGIGEAPRVVLVLGTIEPRKAQTLITEAFERVAAKHPDVLLVLVGDAETAYSAALRNYVESDGLAGRVRIEPVTKDIYVWYRAADLFVCGSDIESLPRSVLEVMIFGVPVLATAIFGLPELIEDGVNGFLYRPRSLDSAAEAFDRVLSLERGDLEEVAAAGERLARARHDSRGYAQRVAELLRWMRLHPASRASDLVPADGRS